MEIVSRFRNCALLVECLSSVHGSAALRGRSFSFTRKVVRHDALECCARRRPGRLGGRAGGVGETLLRLLVMASLSVFSVPSRCSLRSLICERVEITPRQ